VNRSEAPGAFGASGNPAFAVALEAPTTVVLEKMDAKLMDLWLKGAELPSGVVNSKPVSPTGSKAVRLKGRGFLRGEREDEA
jgi:hypothetical protein